MVTEEVARWGRGRVLEAGGGTHRTLGIKKTCRGHRRVGPRMTAVINYVDRRG